MCSRCAELGTTCPVCLKWSLVGRIEQIMGDSWSLETEYDGLPKALLPLIEAERQKARNETAKAIRDEIKKYLPVQWSSEGVVTANHAADMAAAHIKSGDDRA